MTQATIRARIKTVLDTVSNKGQTHDYMRWAVKKQDFNSLFQTTIGGTAQIRAWTITWLGFEQLEPHLGRDADQIRIHNWRIDGYMGLDDSAASEKTFAALAESVCNALDADSTLNASAMTLYREPTRCNVDHRLFGDRLCHHAEISLQTAEVI